VTYIEGFVIPVKTADREAFLAHARRLDPLFLEQGALRVVESWGVKVPEGKVTDFNRAVAAEPGETVAFAWIEWPNRATRDAGMARLEGNPEMMAGPMPFDGRRMIFGEFEVVVDLKA
jgi:uncharacterized protein YbaA (DUF1428 family)